MLASAIAWRKRMAIIYFIRRKMKAKVFGYKKCRDVALCLLMACSLISMFGCQHEGDSASHSGGSKPKTVQGIWMMKVDFPGLKPGERFTRPPIEYLNLLADGTGFQAGHSPIHWSMITPTFLQVESPPEATLKTLFSFEGIRSTQGNPALLFTYDPEHDVEVDCRIQV